MFVLPTLIHYCNSIGRATHSVGLLGYSNSIMTFDNTTFFLRLRCIVSSSKDQLLGDRGPDAGHRSPSLMELSKKVHWIINHVHVSLTLFCDQHRSDYLLFFEHVCCIFIWRSIS